MTDGTIPSATGWEEVSAPTLSGDWLAVVYTQVVIGSWELTGWFPVVRASSPKHGMITCPVAGPFKTGTEAQAVLDSLKKVLAQGGNVPEILQRFTAPFLLPLLTKWIEGARFPQNRKK